MLLCRNARSRKTIELEKGEGQDPSGFGQSPSHDILNIAEIARGPYYEVNGVARPPELHGTPRAELDWAPWIESITVAER